MSLGSGLDVLLEGKAYMFTKGSCTASVNCEYALCPVSVH